MSLLDIKDDVDSYIKDIKNITCLLLEESGQYRFIHGTVQEYYSASFLRSLPEASAIKFYQSCLDEPTGWRWHQELDFLADIDRYRHNKYYFTVFCSRRMGYEHNLDPTFILPSQTSFPRTEKILGSWEIGFVYDGGPRLSSIYFGRTLALCGPDEHDFFIPIAKLDYSEALPSILKDMQLQHSASNQREIVITARQILEKGFFTSEFQSVAQTMSARAYIRWQQAVSYIHRRDAFIQTVDVI